VLRDYLDAWGKALLECRPVEHAAAEAAVRLAYAAGGLAPPRRIIWCGGPLHMAEQMAAASPRDDVGVNVKAQLFDAVHTRVATFAEVFWKEAVVAAAELVGPYGTGPAAEGYAKGTAVTAAVHSLVGDAVNERLSRLTTRARHVARRWRGLPRLLPVRGLDEVAVGPHDLASLGIYRYLHDVLGWREPTRPLQGLWAIAGGADWVVPHEHVCWLAERPTALQTDARSRLHCPTGPALRYQDGWRAYVWKGVQVPAWMIEHPQRITPAKIGETFEPLRRNCMIEIMTPERFVRTGAVGRMSQDETGVLWRASWSLRGIPIGSWSAVEVVDGTAASDGSRRRYFLRVPSRMRTAREAVAWTYGLTAEQYAGLELRT
jgi:hypothetical protein